MAEFQCNCDSKIMEPASDKHDKIIKSKLTTSETFFAIRHFLIPPMACSTRIRELDIFLFSFF